MGARILEQATTIAKNHFMAEVVSRASAFTHLCLEWAA